MSTLNGLSEAFPEMSPEHRGALAAEFDRRFPPLVPRTFRKKPVEIEAMQYDGTVARATEIIDWALANDGTITYRCDDDESCERDSHVLSVRTLEGTMRALPGDWIIRGVQGEFYPCKPDIFEQTYEPAT